MYVRMEYQVLHVWPVFVGSERHVDHDFLDNRLSRLKQVDASVVSDFLFHDDVAVKSDRWWVAVRIVASRKCHPALRHRGQAVAGTATLAALPVNAVWSSMKN